MKGLIRKFWKWILSLVIIGTALAAGSQFLPQEKTPLEIQLGAITYQTVSWDKPKNDTEWKEDVKQEGLNYRLDFQLEEMKAGLEDKLLRVQKPLYDKATLYPDAIRWEYIKAGFEEPDLTELTNGTIAQYIWEYEKMAQSIERINKEIELRRDGKVDRTNDILIAKPSTDKEREELDKLKKLKGL